MKSKPQTRLFYTENHVNKNDDFQTSQKTLEIQVTGQVAVSQVGKYFEGGGKKTLVVERFERPVAESKMMIGKGGKLKKCSGISIKKSQRNNDILKS